MFKKVLSLAAAVLIGLGSVNAQQDFTSKVNTTKEAWGGTGTYWKTVTTFDGRTVNLQEHYGNMDPGTRLSQTVSGLTKGTYEVTVFATSHNAWKGSAGLTEDANDVAYIFAKAGEIELQEFFTARQDPGMSADEPYKVTISNIPVGDDGELTIGLALAQAGKCEWHTIQIYQLTGKLDLSGIVPLYKTALSDAQAAAEKDMPEGLKNDLNAAISTYSSIDETSEEALNEAIAALQAVTERVTAYEIASDVLPKMKAEIDKTNVYTQDAYEEYYGQWLPKYEAGTLTLVEAQVLQDPSVGTGWHDAVTVDNFLLSAWDTNPDFVNAPYYINTWSVEGNNDGTNFRVPFFEYFADSKGSLAERTLTATMEGVEPGSYAVSAWVRVRVMDNVAAAAATGVTLSANSGTAVDVTEGTTVDRFNLAEYQTFCTVGSDGILKIQFNVAADNNVHWLSFKNVKFEKTNLPALYAEINSLVATAEGLVDKDQDETVKANLTAAINNGKDASSVTDPAVLGNIIADLNSAIAASEASIAAYEKAAKEAARKAKWATIEGGVYYFKNISTGRYLGPANNWGTQASLIQHGSPITVAALENGKYTLESRVSNGGSSYYLNGNWMDGAANDIEIIKEGDDYMFYSVADAAYYSAPAEGTVLALDADYTDASKWQLISEADMIASLATATESNPVDVTFLIKDYDLGRNNRDVAAWTKEGGVKGPKQKDGLSVFGAPDTGNWLCEAYHNAFNMYQTLTDIPNGLYELKVNAFYSGEDTKLPTVYAESGINNGSAEFPVRTGEENDMLAAAVSFAAGNYLSEGAKVLVTNGKLKIGVKFEESSLWCIWDNFQLSYLRPATEAEIAEGECDNILAEMLEVYQNTTVPTANVGTEPFQYNAAAVAAVQALVTQYGDYTPAQAKMALQAKGWYTKATMTEKLAEGKAFVAAMQVLNAPKANTRYYIKPATEGHAKLGNAVVAKLGTVTANNPTGYAFNASDAPADYLAQAFIFTSANDATQPNAYYISIVLPEGEVYLTNGTQNGSAAGWKDSQIQGTTDAEKKLAFIIKATDKDNVFNIVNPATNSTIDCQDGGSLYTEDKGKADFSVAEASEANVAIAIDEAVKYATCIFPFVPELPAAVKAYTCAVVDGTTLTLEEVTTPEANKPYILEATAGCTANLANYGTANTTSYEAGLLTGVYAETVAPAGTYVLQDHDGQVAFYQVESEGAVTVPAGKAYLQLAEESEVKAIFFPGDEATAISGIASLTSAGVKGIYNAAGAKVNSLQKGVNIVKTADGKTLKVYVK